MSTGGVGRAYIEQARRHLADRTGRIKHCVGQLDDTQVWWRPHGSLNSVGNLLLHLCGNGRIEPGEQCDPNAPNSCFGACNTSSHTCVQNPTIPCASDGQCAGSCLPQGDPMECSCLF